ncbi:M23 family metallopeptidase [Hymenobacter sp. BRD128]|uniref:M23 family metallopeptidase n=1 Tax=Hymenobacter sp. BRD128 TaxID=2675878 RepID=UPI0015659CB8|nr:M23 family metallopeptidase [Hymenobacter sp. BRD128]QKG56582.1 M23 family metallopeptidase [Hymenobacter sp. BRD128]
MLFSFFPPAGRRRAGGFLVVLLALLASCSKPQTLAALFQKTTPHEDYARALDRAGLQEAALGRQWHRAAAQALRDSLVVTLPMLETGYFRPEQPMAASYRYAVRAGELVHVRLTLAPGPTLAPRVFVDAFGLAPGQQPQLVKWTAADTTAAGTYDYSYQVADDGQHLLRVQPELLAAGRYTLRLWRGPGLGLFPVKGRTDQAIGSFWGNARDGGARCHEGVDIFAPRGTPAVAATDGYVTRTGETTLGGRVVWLADPQGQHLYYAHLDKQLVQPGQHVRAGDTLGLVGNTGNARTTAPHLHFGIYRVGGAVDPWPFLHRADPVPTALASPDRRGEWVRPRPGQASYHLPATLPLLVLGQRADYLRVALPNGQHRYVAARTVAPAQPLRRLVLAVAHEIQTAPLASAPALAAWPSQTAATVLGQSNGYALLRNAAGQQGWAKI